MRLRQMGRSRGRGGGLNIGLDSGWPFGYTARLRCLLFLLHAPQPADHLVSGVSPDRYDLTSPQFRGGARLGGARGSDPAARSESEPSEGPRHLGHRRLAHRRER